ncbi:hypothetical protein VP01_1789g1 [Puccinia sorghi]|uniref:Uncharacterized protein n=1 Tax=Puccinia sorghi TaxID=27349 RepID=A0A0L6VGE3_9BASI|nr:hypothetical protein VP01_1789g1 [Puccinia sorghi]
MQDGVRCDFFFDVKLNNQPEVLPKSSCYNPSNMKSQDQKENDVIHAQGIIFCIEIITTHISYGHHFMTLVFFFDLMIKLRIWIKSLLVSLHQFLNPRTKGSINPDNPNYRSLTKPTQLSQTIKIWEPTKLLQISAIHDINPVGKLKKNGLGESLAGGSLKHPPTTTKTRMSHSRCHSLPKPNFKSAKATGKPLFPQLSYFHHHIRPYTMNHNMLEIIKLNYSLLKALCSPHSQGFFHPGEYHLKLRPSSPKIRLNLCTISNQHTTVIISSVYDQFKRKHLHASAMETFLVFLLVNCRHPHERINKLFNFFFEFKFGFFFFSFMCFYQNLCKNPHGGILKASNLQLNSSLNFQCLCSGDDICEQTSCGSLPALKALICLHDSPIIGVGCSPARLSKVGHVAQLMFIITLKNQTTFQDVSKNLRKKKKKNIKIFSNPLMKGFWDHEILSLILDRNLAHPLPRLPQKSHVSPTWTAPNAINKPGMNKLKDPNNFSGFYHTVLNEQHVPKGHTLPKFEVKVARKKFFVFLAALKKELIIQNLDKLVVWPTDGYNYSGHLIWLTFQNKFRTTFIIWAQFNSNSSWGGGAQLLSLDNLTDKSSGTYFMRSSSYKIFFSGGTKSPWEPVKKRWKLSGAFTKARNYLESAQRLPKDVHDQILMQRPRGLDNHPCLQEEGLCWASTPKRDMNESTRASV